MSIDRLKISNVRNIVSADLSPNRVNVLHGRNGSGKTSVLEAAHILGSGRSFRSTQLIPVIRHSTDQCTVFGSVSCGAEATAAIGVRRARDGSFESRINGVNARSSAELARRLPLLLINSDTFQLLEGGPKVRRQFLDWGVFHVEHCFHAAWMEVHRCLRQRNSLLRRAKIAPAELAVWDNQLAVEATRLDAYRASYFDQFVPVFEQTLSELIQLEGLSLSYQRGWDRESDLRDVLTETFGRDCERGFTGNGPHRADIRLRFKGVAAADVLSRGQQKLVVCAMKVAQAALFSSARGVQSVFLVDDLPAELDRDHRRLLCQLLVRMNCQVFVTCVDASELTDCWSGVPASAIRLFHVEHGSVRSHQ